MSPHVKKNLRNYPNILFTKLLKPDVIVDRIPFSLGDAGGLANGIP